MTHSTVTAEPGANPQARSQSGQAGRFMLRAGAAGLALATGLSFLGSYEYALDLLSHFRVHLLAASALLALLLVVVRDGKTAIFATLLLVGNAAGLWPQQTAETIAHADVTRPLKLVTFNIWASNADTDNIAAYLLKTDADVIVIQEFWLHTGKLKRLLKTRYPWQRDCRNVPHCDIALFSKKPWKKSGIVQPVTAHPSALWATFGTGDAAFTIVGAHFDRPPSLRHKQQLDSMADWIRKQPGPVIIAGDFNATPWSHAMTGFRQRAGLGIVPGYRPTWPAHRLFAQLPIDHVLVSPAIGSVSAERGRFAGSDHLPVSVELSLP